MNETTLYTNRGRFAKISKRRLSSCGKLNEDELIFCSKTVLKRLRKYHSKVVREVGYDNDSLYDICTYYATLIPYDEKRRRIESIVFVRKSVYRRMLREMLTECSYINCCSSRNTRRVSHPITNFDRVKDGSTFNPIDYKLSKRVKTVDEIFERRTLEEAKEKIVEVMFKLNPSFTEQLVANNFDLSLVKAHSDVSRQAVGFRWVNLIDETARILRGMYPDIVVGEAKLRRILSGRSFDIKNRLNCALEMASLLIDSEKPLTRKELKASSSSMNYDVLNLLTVQGFVIAEKDNHSRALNLSWNKDKTLDDVRSSFQCF